MRATVPGRAQVSLAEIVVHAAFAAHWSSLRDLYGVGMNSTDGRRWLRLGYNVMSS